MRIVIVDLHCNGFFLRNLEYIMNKRQSVRKHAFFIDAALNDGYEVLNYITGTSSGLWLGKNSLFLNRLEAKYILRKNGFWGKIKNITNQSEIRQDDLVIFYSHLDDSFDIRSTPGHKYCNVNHFFSMRSVNGVLLRDRLTKEDFEGYICEADVMNESAFFRKYLPVDKKIILMPYIAEMRFQREKTFQDRKNKAVALGSCGIESDLFMDVYGTKQLHPMRNELWLRRNKNIEQIDCMIEKIVSPKDYFKMRADENRFVKFSKRVFNHYYRNRNSPFRKNGRNAGYYNKDMVKLLNQYRMFIYPEEITGMPALGFVEGMSCGCAYIGLESPMYTNLGMKSGIHYIGYNGSYNDMIEKIRYYQIQNDELEKIAENGYRFVKENLTSKKVFRKFIEQLRTAEGVDAYDSGI